jgi:dUTPase
VLIPEGFSIRVTSHSGLALQQYIDIIDHKYNGNIGVFLYNQSENPFVVRRGDIIANITFHKFYYPHIEEVDKLTVTCPTREMIWFSLK